MKTNKHITIFIVLIIYIIFKSSVNATISDNFKFVIDTIGIPQFNVYNEEINENIYYSYNVFVYSNPIKIQSQTNLQRFKQVDNQGRWTLDGSNYQGSGVRGEYDILGRSYSGSLIYNVYFPVDAMPETLPERWNFVEIPDAINSWNDSNKYKYIEQLDYMKNVKLLFDKLNYEDSTSDPYNLIEYNISANSIGLDKVMLNTCSTWKTMGVVSINRKNNLGQVRYATLVAPPMEASADIKSNLIVDDNFEIGENEDNILIPINFYAQLINLKNYANVKHVKQISSTLYINDKQISTISGSKTVKVDKDIIYTVSRENNFQDNYPLKIKVISYLYTEFNVDGLMKNELEKTIYIDIKPKNVRKVENISIANL